MECYVDDYITRNGAKIILDIMHEKEAQQKLLQLRSENAGLKQLALKLVEKLKFLEVVLVSMVNPFFGQCSHFIPLKTPEKVFSGGIKWEHWPETG